MDFQLLKTAVTARFNELSHHRLFRTNAEKDELWDTYLNSFPEGTNPLFRKRTAHDCGCCRQFIRAVGNTVAIINNEVVSIWDVVVPDPAYQAVADAMSQLVKSKSIRNPFLHVEKTAGTDKNYEDSDGKVFRWDHFYVQIPHGRNTGHNYYCRGVEIGPRLSESTAVHDVFLRSLKEITRAAIDTTLELISQNSLYRGQEQQFAVNTFLKLHEEFHKLPENQRDNFVWSKIDSVPGSVAKIRGSAIGTLLSDLSEGYDLDDCVRSFESKVAPANYKRPTALVTKSMVDAARKSIEELGLTGALDRRYAMLADITVEDALFVNNETRLHMRGDVFDSIVTKSTTANLDRVESVTIDTFMNEIVPRAESIELFFDNTKISNLVSLIAPVNSAANSLFKWKNNFSWSYNGDMADSLKERVKQAGGNVIGELCCRLSWNNHDDLDLHLREPDGNEICFHNKGISERGGCLDVDMNAGYGRTRTPVENIFYSRRAQMKEGNYALFVHQYSRRESEHVGFDVEIDYMGSVMQFAHAGALRTKEHVVVAKFNYTHRNGIVFVESLPSTQATKAVWGINTQDFHKVNVLMMSPNYWNNQGVGNKHYFFMLANCRNDGTARGFFNEFLKEELTPHRKVIEIVGSKMKTEQSEHQLSGLGFSSTQRNEILIRVKGSFTRQVKVSF